MFNRETPLAQALASTDFLRLWIAGLCAGVMRWLEILAVGVYTLEVTGSAFTVALMYFARTVPTLFGGPICGALAERLNRKHMYAIGVSVMLLVSVALAVLAWTGALQLWHVATGAVLSGVVWSMEHTVRRTVARDVVPPGAPAVDSAGPALPAEATKTTPCSSTTTRANSAKRPLLGVFVGSP